MCKYGQYFTVYDRNVMINSSNEQIVIIMSTDSAEEEWIINP